MASLVKVPTSKYWIAAFRDASGRQHRRTTREIDRKRAQVVADKYERVAQRKGSPQRVRQILSEFFRDHYGEALPFASVRNCALEWLATRKAETSVSTQQCYGGAVQKFLAFLGADADKALEEVSRTQIAAFRDARIQESATLTANADLTIIKSIFKAARRDGYVFQDPAEGVKPAKNHDPFVRRPFTLDELRAVLAIADSEWQSLIKFGLYTGQRLGDLAMLIWTQIDLEREEIRLTDRKTGKSLLIPIAAPLREHLLTIASTDNPQNPVHPRSYAIVAQKGKVAGLSDQFSDLLTAAGLRPRRIHQGRTAGRSAKRIGFSLSFHSLRHTAVSLLKDAGVPDAVVMALVGHASAAMSQRYTHVGKEALSKAAKTLPEI
jgi:integrase